MTKVNHQSHCELVEGKESIQNEGILSHLKRKHVSEIELVLFAFALVLGNRNVTWNQSLVYGFDSYLFNVLFVGSAYVCLALCMGEMSSALPFSGGIFGFVRAAAGPYFGYVTSWFEIAFVSTYVIIKVDQLIKIMVALKVMAKDFTPYAVVVFYTSSFILNVLGGKPLWGLVCIIGFAAFCLYLIYLGGAADAGLSDGSLDYQTFCQTGIPLTMGNIMPGRSNINGFYQGLQFVPLLSDTLKNPRDQVPRALMICAVVFVFFSVFLSLSSCSQYPGITKLTKAKYPLVYGFSNVFNVSLQDSIWFNVPGMYGVAFCLFYCGGKQIHAISKSGLLKSALSFTTPVLDTPYMSYLVSTVSGIVLNVYVFYYPEGYDELRNIAVLASHLVFFIAFLTFILFKFNYSSLTRSFTSPLGIWGAIYGMGNYFIGLVSIVFYSGNTYYSVYALICVFAFSSGLFWLIIARNQSFSEEEKKLMFKAYLINANREKRMKILKRNKKGVQSSTNSKGASTSNVNKSNLPGCDASEIIRLPESSSPDQNECCDVEEPSKNLATTRLPANTSFSSQVTPPQTEPLSVRINTLLSGKMHAVFPSDSMKSSSSTKIDRQLLILEAGGLLDRASEKALCAELGLDADFCENIIQETEHQLETHHIHQNI